jgi:hypothetical protein
MLQGHEVRLAARLGLLEECNTAGSQTKMERGVWRLDKRNTQLLGGDWGAGVQDQVCWSKYETELGFGLPLIDLI